MASPVLGSISDSEIPRDVLSSLRQAKGRASLSQIPKRLAVDLRSHTKAVNALDWSPSHGINGFLLDFVNILLRFVFLLL